MFKFTIIVLGNNRTNFSKCLPCSSQFQVSFQLLSTARMSTATVSLFYALHSFTADIQRVIMRLYS